MKDSRTELGRWKGALLGARQSSRVVRRVYSGCRRLPLLGRVLGFAVRIIFPQGTRTWSIIPSGNGTGFWFYCDPRSEAGYWNGDHEPWVQETMRKLLAASDCFYDVGAHTSFFCLLAAQAVGRKGLAVGLEPDPENAAVFRANVAKNGMTCVVKVVEAAAWSHPGELRFRREPMVTNGTQGSVAQMSSEDRQGIVVPALSVDSLVFEQGTGKPQLLKIDVEGAEWEVLHGAQRTMRELRPAILCEVHSPDAVEPIRAFLGSFGYSTEHWQPVHPHYNDYKQEYIWAHCAQGRNYPRQ